MNCKHCRGELIRMRKPDGELSKIILKCVNCGKTFVKLKYYPPAK
jgi:uncharacterized C2H2 Zn-finger protein